MEKMKKAALLGLLVAGVACAVMGVRYPSARLIESAGLIFDIAGIVQLEISGLFEKFLNKYSDEKKYPYGPPSHITRRIIDDAEKPVQTWILNQIFYEHRSGFWLLVLGFLFQLLANWFGAISS